MSSQVCRSARFALEGAIAWECLRGGLVAAQQGLWEAQGRFRGSQATNCSLFACSTQSLTLMMLQQQRPSRTGPLSHLGRAWQRPQRPAAAQGTQSGGAAAPTAPPTSGTVTVLFKGAQVVTEAQPGENLLEVRCADWRATYALRGRGQQPGLAPDAIRRALARPSPGLHGCVLKPALKLLRQVAERCGISLPAGCHQGNCGICEVDVVKVGRAAGAAVLTHQRVCEYCGSWRCTQLAGPLKLALGLDAEQDRDTGPSSPPPPCVPSSIPPGGCAGRGGRASGGADVHRGGAARLCAAGD